MKVPIVSKYALAAALSAVTSLPAFAGGFTFQDIIDPNATTTRAYGINNAGTISGQAWGGSAGQKTFELSGGNFTLYNAPSSSGTYIGRINNNGELVFTGAVWNGSGYDDRGFTYLGGTYASVSVPGTTGTLAYQANDSGVIVGSSWSAAGGWTGFTDTANSFSTISDPSSSGTTYAFGINNAGTVVGAYQSANSYLHGYVLQNGTYTTVDVPNASTTEIFGINSSGNMVGYTSGSFCQGTNQGFCGFYYSGGTFTQIAITGAADTFVYGINDLNQIVGEYLTSDNVTNGFLGTPVSSSSAPEPGSVELAAGAALFAGLTGLRKRFSAKLGGRR